MQQYVQIDLFDALRLEDMPVIDVGDICILSPRDENVEHYKEYYPHMLRKEVKVVAVTYENANAIKPAAWIERNGVETCCYFDDLTIVQKV